MFKSIHWARCTQKCHPPPGIKMICAYSEAWVHVGLGGAALMPPRNWAMKGSRRARLLYGTVGVACATFFLSAATDQPAIPTVASEIVQGSVLVQGILPNPPPDRPPVYFAADAIPP